MKKVRIFFDWFLKFGTSCLLVLFMIFSHFSILPSLLFAQNSINKKETFEYQGILELWHIETFEGGSQNRGKFLEKVARKFEKLHRGTYVVVLSMSLEQFELNYNAAKMPNIISFGVGIGDKLTKSFVPLDVANNVRSDLLSGGKFSSKQLAVPYMLGGYVFVSNKTLQNSLTGKTGVGLLGTTNPLCAAKENNIKFDLYGNNLIDSYNAYDKFLKGSFENLLGTQRDLYRISNRQQKGLLTEYNIYPLGKYTDLVQYVSVCQKEKTETELSKQFADYLVSSEVQQSIADISMFSVLDNADLYDNGIYKDMEATLNQKLTTENAFATIENINNKKERIFNENK